MGEFSISNQKFDDIEMLEIPEDDVSSSSETEGIVESPSSSVDKASSKSTFQKQATYIELQEWLNSDKSLEFQFDEEQYNQSLTQTDDYSKHYSNYVSSLYKIIENLTNDNITRIDLEQEEEPIGLITTAPDIGTNADRKFKYSKINEAFGKIVENLSNFIDEVSKTNEKDIEQYYFLLNILECLRANYFYPEIKLKPDLLSTWINKYDFKPDNELIEPIMISTPKPYLHPQFWNTYLAQLITRGLLNQAHDAITHSKFEELKDISPDLYSIILDFQTLLANYSNMSLKDQFPQWKLSCCELRDMFSKFKSNITDSTHLIIFSQIYDLLCILTGLPKTISSHCENWYEIFVALSLYQVRDGDDLYKEYYDISVYEKSPAIIGDEEEDLFKITEQCFVDILEENFLKALKTIHQFDPATAAYISKLFELKGYLNNYYSITNNSKNLQDLINKKTISEYFLIIHAYQCLNLHDLVPVGIGLLLNTDISTSNKSTSNNRNVIADFLPKFKCKTNDDLEWALTICAKLNLISTARELYYIYGLKSLEDGFIYESLNMLVNCYHPTSNESTNDEGMKKVHYIIWNLIFQDSLVNNRPIEDELINNIIDNKVDKSLEIHPVIRQCLSPYAVLVSFFKSLKDSTNNKSNNAIDQLSKLIHLLRFNYLPKKFYPLLLSQILPFLVNSNYKFDLPDLIVIIELIDIYESQFNDEEYKEGESLYKFSIDHIEANTESYDWRILLRNQHVEIPKDIKHLIKFLRNEIVAKIGKVYIEHN